LVLFLALTAVVLKKRDADPEVKYDAVIYLFLLYVGNGLLMAEVMQFAKKIFKGRYGADWIVFAMAVCAVLFPLTKRIKEAATHIPSRYETVGSVLNVGDAKAAAEWINEHVDANDLVIAPERIDFLMECRVVSPYQAAAFNFGSTTWHHNLTPERFAFDCAFSSIRFIVIDWTDREIVLHPANPNMDRMIEEIYSGRWKLEAAIGEYWIYSRVTDDATT